MPLSLTELLWRLNQRDTHSFRAASVVDSFKMNSLTDCVLPERVENVVDHKGLSQSHCSQITQMISRHTVETFTHTQLFSIESFISPLITQSDFKQTLENLTWDPVEFDSLWGRLRFFSFLQLQCHSSEDCNAWRFAFAWCSITAHTHKLKHRLTSVWWAFGLTEEPPPVHEHRHPLCDYSANYTNQHTNTHIKYFRT